MKPLVCDLSREDLAGWCVGQGQGTFRADQIRRWTFGKRVDGFAAMTDLPGAFRERLDAQFEFLGSTVVRHLVSDDGTEKLLVRLRDGEHLECVLMREEDRRTICVSTQVGCGMGCVFCASGLLGFTRNLSAGEIVEQVLHLDRLLPSDERITNVVVMGMGEPLANLGNLLKALASLCDKGALGLAARRITISTVGLPEKIRELSRIKKQFNLAVSLHAPNDELRNRLVPVNARTGLEAIFAAVDEYFDRTGRRVTYEYVVLDEVNDLPEHAQQLAALLRGRCAHINLIPMNAVSELPYRDPRSSRLHAFREVLEESGIAVTVRKRKGADIDAACGQLRLRQETEATSVGGMAGFGIRDSTQSASAGECPDS